MLRAYYTPSSERSVTLAGRRDKTQLSASSKPVCQQNFSHSQCVPPLHSNRSTHSPLTLRLCARDLRTSDCLSNKHTASTPRRIHAHSQPCRVRVRASRRVNSEAYPRVRLERRGLTAVSECEQCSRTVLELHMLECVRTLGCGALLRTCWSNACANSSVLFRNAVNIAIRISRN